MTRKILSLFVIFSLSASISVLAQGDTKAKTILESVSKKINGLKSLKANFTLQLAGSNGKVRETKKGSFSMKGQKYHVLLNGQEIICDTKNVWTYVKETNEVQISTYNPNEQTISPAKLFTNFYDKEYAYKYLGERKVNGKSCDVVELIPKDKNKQFAKIELAVDKASNSIVGGNIWEKNGNKYVYSVEGFTPNAPVADSYFTFDTKAHPGVEVVDLR